jgi:5-hydroxyisourate hydrolase-like protein (transthyretin family)
MLCRKFILLSLVLAGLGLAAAPLSAQQEDTHKPRKFKVPPPSSRIEVTVLRDANGKPVENAAVIFHPIEGDRDKGVMELKTNEEGKAVIDVIPLGDTVRLQIIAHGFQTLGRDFKVDKDTISMEVRLKRPGEQYSIYKTSTQPSGNAATDAVKSAPANAQPEAGKTQPQPK